MSIQWITTGQQIHGKISVREQQDRPDECCVQNIQHTAAVC